MNKTQLDRLNRLMPFDETRGICIPRYVRCYDNGGESVDRYTVVYSNTKDGICHYVGMSGSPFHPQGVGQHGEHTSPIDKPSYKHLGKKIQFTDLPNDCQSVVLTDYIEIWKLEYAREKIFIFYNRYWKERSAK